METPPDSSCCRCKQLQDPSLHRPEQQEAEFLYTENLISGGAYIGQVFRRTNPPYFAASFQPFGKFYTCFSTLGTPNTSPTTEDQKILTVENARIAHFPKETSNLPWRIKRAGSLRRDRVQIWGVPQDKEGNENRRCFGLNGCFGNPSPGCEKYPLGRLGAKRRQMQGLRGIDIRRAVYRAKSTSLPTDVAGVPGSV